MAQIIDGKALAEKFRAQIKADIDRLKTKGIQPGLAFVMVGKHPPSQIYVANKQKACAAVGIDNFLDALPADTSEQELLAHIDKLNRNPKIHGILVQLPIPPHINTKKVICQIDPKKDVDGLHPENLGKFFLNLPGTRPPTAQGILHLIETTGINIKGKDACMVGRSAIVGRPTAMLLAKNHATVTLCHRFTENLPEKTKVADILVVAIGHPRYIQGDWIKKGAVVIDVGITRLPDASISGDVDFAAAKKRASAISPVPGGVGPMTIAMLLKNTVDACETIERIS
ncbi:MAG: bifunctional methylenetetrahydrofolate dehydrogenase/methenyltetrahydrofolate cyclohydrolase FolD [Deltaproteobacteria bacterium]|nr:bifunctional methylenetetrahydrofolate dehydrogenase/methenyltetrahydrofolate cyclohydrolase FolD [Deltaproteobacteria bacterium]MBI4223869.1 bifunctional methylenetetrahydrofolate dehydrogenase/methenyltetrahydrofolate cyclohydrolase FolD [Deltaproteobacteria bacterium]